MVYSSSEEFKLGDVAYLQYNHFKPNGLWVSVEGFEEDINWKDWCEAEEFRLEHLKYAYEIILKPDHNLLILTSPAQLQEFTENYKGELIPGLRSIDIIQWGLVAQKYTGILIAPYQWSCRFEPGLFWYYGWDCASGCIWDLRVIKSINLQTSP